MLQAVDAVVQLLQDLRVAGEMVQSSLSDTLFSTGNNSRRVGELLDYASDGPFGSKIKTEHYADAGVRVIRLQNVDINRFNNADKAFVTSRYFKDVLSNNEVLPGDVVVAGLGDDTIPAGRACVVPDHIGVAVNKADCFCLRAGKELYPQFLAFFLNSSVGLKQSAAFSQGTTRLRLNLGNIKRMTMPLPNIERQKEIATQLEIVLGQTAAWKLDMN